MRSFNLEGFSEWRRLPSDVLWNDTWDTSDDEALICKASCYQLGTVKQPEFNPSFIGRRWDLYLALPPHLNSIGRQLSTAQESADPRPAARPTTVQQWGNLPFDSSTSIWSRSRLLQKKFLALLFRQTNGNISGTKVTFSGYNNLFLFPHSIFFLSNFIHSRDSSCCTNQSSSYTRQIRCAPPLIYWVTAVFALN